MNTQNQLHTMIERLDSLPPIPKIAQKILALKVGTEDGERELFGLIEKDPALMAKIIGLSNSPLFFRGRTVLTLHDAEAVLGSKRVKMTALGCAMMSSISKQQSGLLNFDSYWKHSLSIAMTMDTLTKYMPKDRCLADDEVYLAGLLHDIGFLVLNYLDTELCDQLYTRMLAEPFRPVEEIEAEILEMNHCELGAHLTRHWGLPKNITAAIRDHHNRSDSPDAEQQPLAKLAYFAEKLLPAFDSGESEFTKIDYDEWQLLGIDPILFEEIMNKVKNHIDQADEISV